MIQGGRDCKEIERKKIGAKSEQKQSENRAKTGLYEILQPKEIFCENSTLLPNHSATHLTPLRKFSQLRNQVWHTSATSQNRSPHFEAVNRLRSYKAWKYPFSQSKLHSAGYFTTAKPSLAHECHFAAQWHPFRSCEMGCEVGCENSFLLQNRRSSAKLKMTFNISLFLYIPVIWVSKGFQKEGTP